MGKIARLLVPLPKPAYRSARTYVVRGPVLLAVERAMSGLNDVGVAYASERLSSVGRAKYMPTVGDINDLLHSYVQSYHVNIKSIITASLTSPALGRTKFDGKMFIKLFKQSNLDDKLFMLISRAGFYSLGHDAVDIVPMVFQATIGGAMSIA